MLTDDEVIEVGKRLVRIKADAAQELDKTISAATADLTADEKRLALSVCEALIQRQRAIVAAPQQKVLQGPPVAPGQVS